MNAAGNSFTVILNVTVTGMVTADNYSPIQVTLENNAAWSTGTVPNAAIHGSSHTYTIPLTGQSLDPNNHFLGTPGGKQLTVSFTDDDANPNITAPPVTLTVSFVWLCLGLSVTTVQSTKDRFASWSTPLPALVD